MTYAVVYIIFITVLASWIRYEHRLHHVSLKTQWPWVASAACFGFLGVILSVLCGGKLGNFFLHSVGGGMAAACLFVYLTQTFSFKQNWRIELVLLFAFISAVGSLNEIAEYALELLNFDIFSIDTHDTWRDIVANTTGGVVAWVGSRTILALAKSQKSNR